MVGVNNYSYFSKEMCLLIFTKNGRKVSYDDSIGALIIIIKLCYKMCLVRLRKEKYKNIGNSHSLKPFKNIK